MSVVATSVLELSPLDAVAVTFREIGSGDAALLLPSLDRVLRQALVQYLQVRSPGEGGLRRALLRAWREAERQGWEPWRHRWSCLLEILDDGERSPSLAADLQAAS